MGACCSSNKNNKEDEFLNYVPIKYDNHKVDYLASLLKEKKFLNPWCHLNLDSYLLTLKLYEEKLIPFFSIEEFFNEIIFFEYNLQKTEIVIWKIPDSEFAEHRKNSDEISINLNRSVIKSKVKAENELLFINDEIKRELKEKSYYSLMNIFPQINYSLFQLEKKENRNRLRTMLNNKKVIIHLEKQDYLSIIETNNNIFKVLDFKKAFLLNFDFDKTSITFNNNTYKLLCLLQRMYHLEKLSFFLLLNSENLSQLNSKSLIFVDFTDDYFKETDYHFELSVNDEKRYSYLKEFIMIIDDTNLKIFNVHHECTNENIKEMSFLIENYIRYQRNIILRVSRLLSNTIFKQFVIEIFASLTKLKPNLLEDLLFSRKEVNKIFSNLN